MMRLIILRGCDLDSNYSKIFDKKNVTDPEGDKSVFFYQPLMTYESLASCLRKLFFRCLLKNPLTSHWNCSVCNE